jgi:AraC-like DNA-binding protein
MNSRLNQIQNWPERAEQAKWSVSALAKNCGVSVRTLEIHFLALFGKCPRTWITEQRRRISIQLLQDGCNVNETATKVGFAHASSFCRKFPGLRVKTTEKTQSQLPQGNISQTANSFSQKANSF